MVETALLLVDLQNDYCKPNGVFASKAGFLVDDIGKIYGATKKLIHFFRRSGCPVIWITMIWDRDEDVGVLATRSTFLQTEGLRRGTWGAEIVEDLDVQPTDYRVEKSRFSAFYQTDLESLLRSLSVQHLVIAGVRTDFCVESTVRDAFFRDYEVTVAADAVAGYFKPLHEASLRVMQTVFARVLDTEEIIDRVGTPK